MQSRRLTRRLARPLAATLLLTASVTGLGAGAGRRRRRRPGSGLPEPDRFAAAQPGHGQPAARGHRRLPLQCLGGRVLPQRRRGPDADRALERIELARLPQPQPRLCRQPAPRSPGQVQLGYLGGGRLLQRACHLQDPGAALERPGLEAGTEPEPGNAGRTERRARDLRHQTRGRSATPSTATARPRCCCDGTGTPGGRRRARSRRHRATSSAVTATSVRNAWAVGYSETKSSQPSLILHWNGRRWARVASPSPGGENTLMAVAASSARNAWAVGVELGQ